MASNRGAIISAVVVMILVAFVWLRLSQNETDSGSTDFSSWSKKKSEGDAPGDVETTQQQNLAQETTGQFTTNRAAASGAPHVSAAGDFRRNIDPSQALNDRARGAMGATFQPSRSAQEAYKKLPRLKREINSQPYEILAAWAVPKEAYTASMGEVLQTHGNYNIVAVDQTASESWKTLILRPETRPVLESPGGRTAVVTGTIEVKVTTLENAGAIADAEHLQVLGVDEQIKTVFYRAPSGYALLSGVERLKKRPDVERVELEIDQSRKVGR